MALGGKGASGEVLRARDGAGRELALKIALADGAEARRVFSREAGFASLSPSAALPELVDLGFLVREGDWAEPASPGTPGARPFLAFAWMPGDAATTQLGGVGVELSLRVARDVGQGLSDLHALGIAHGDVKPANVLLTPDRARIVDLGLAAPAYARNLEGATPRYLGRGDAEIGDGRSRDVLALGVMLAELADPAVASATSAIEAARAARLPGVLSLLCAAALAPSPAARPSARWIAETARAALGGADGDAPERRVQRVRATYLAIRAGELAGATGAVETTAAWLSNAVRATRRARSLVGDGGSAAGLLGPLEPEDRARWLTALVGAAAASWPLSTLGDVEERRLGAALEALARQRSPEAFRFADLEAALRGELAPSTLTATRTAPKGETTAGEVASDAQHATALALAVAATPASPEALTAIERWAEAPPALVRAAADALRRAGEIGRARSLVASGRCGSGADAAAVSAEVFRRSGDTDLARESALLAIEAGDEGGDRGRAVVARIALDQGKLDEAAQWVGAHPMSPALCEVGALVAAERGDGAAARRLVDRGEAMGGDEEQRARLAGARGYVAHAEAPAASLSAFGAAAAHAARAGALVEEATYRTGEAAAAVGAGEIGRALETSRRAALLWEHLGRPAMAARALLAQAAAYAAVGATHEASRASRSAVARAREGGDVRAAAYAEWAITDAYPDGDVEALAAAERAASALRGGTGDDELRAEARILRHAGTMDETRIRALDDMASAGGVAADARLDWWGARAALLLRSDRASVTREAEAPIAALLALADARAEVSRRGRALFAGAELAARAGRSDAAQRLHAARSEAARELLRGTPAELLDAARALTWTAHARALPASPLEAEQARDLEALVRSFGDRERLGPLLNRVVDALVLWTGVERGLLLLRAPDGRLVPRAARNLARADLTTEQLALSQSLARRALEAREPVVAVDAAGEMSSLHASVHALRLRSVLAVPLLARGEALGVAYLDDRVRRGAFGERELEWVRTVAALAALAIADARDQVLLRRAARKARRAKEKLAEVLARREAELDVAERELSRVRGARGTRFRYDAIVGDSRPLADLLKIVDRVSQSDVPVLIFGPSGSGKELIARAIHDNSPRAAHSFVGENCGAIPEGLLESTLFGHVRGAFTGADRPRAGLFEVAHRGTLFLDEIGEMSLPMQTKLLRVIEDGDLRPVGSERGRKVDVRIVAATHRDIEAMVRARTFREDLYYRLNIIPLRVPPLSARPGDVPVLVRHFLAKHGGTKTKVTPAAMDRWMGYAWPGNVRQLENEVRRALVLCDGLIGVEHLSPEVAASPPAARSEGLDMRSRIDALELTLVREALERTRGNQTQAAKALGLSRFGLQKMIKRLGIV